jgi:hypothetical protein
MFIAVAASGETEELRAEGPHRGYFGLATEVVARGVSGLRVVEVDRDGPAQRAGILDGDVLLSRDGEDLAFGDDLEAIASFSEYAPGQVVEFRLVRRGATHTVRLTVGDPPPLRPASTLSSDHLRTQCSVTAQGLSQRSAHDVGETWILSEGWKTFILGIKRLSPPQAHITLHSGNDGIVITSVASDILPAGFCVDDLPPPLLEKLGSLRTGHQLRVLVSSEGSSMGFRLRFEESQ